MCIDSLDILLLTVVVACNIILGIHTVQFSASRNDCVIINDIVSFVGMILAQSYIALSVPNGLRQLPLWQATGIHKYNVCKAKRAWSGTQYMHY